MFPEPSVAGVIPDPSPAVTSPEARTISAVLVGVTSTSPARLQDQHLASPEIVGRVRLRAKVLYDPSDVFIYTKKKTFA